MEHKDAILVVHYPPDKRDAYDSDARGKAGCFQCGDEDDYDDPVMFANKHMSGRHNVVAGNEDSVLGITLFEDDNVGLCPG